MGHDSDRAEGDRVSEAGPQWAEMQSSVFNSHSAYAHAPHLRHPRLKQLIAGTLADLVTEIRLRTGACRVLDIGAGHGDFTNVLLQAGANVVVSEMSEASVKELSRRYGTLDTVDVVYDPTGERVFERYTAFDLVTCISLLHHIPDYLAFVRRLTGLITNGGAFASFQDPMLYSTQSKAIRILHRSAFYMWRVGQGNLRRGLQTTIRRARGVFDVEHPSDMVEYHVVRDGVNHLALLNLLQKSFDQVRLVTYWSTPATPMQRLGERLRLESEFGLVARGLVQPLS